MDSSLGIKAKNSLEKLAKQVDLRLEKYWNKEIGRSFGFEESQKRLVDKVLEHSKEHNLRPAKRARAAFVYYGYLLSGKIPNEEVWKVMEGVELVQTALLMHDDFMDEDLLRRGLPTTHEFFADGDKHYGESMAVSVGDVVLCLGYERVMECDLNKEKVLDAVKILMRGITNTALGQIYDIALPRLGELTEEKVLAVHRAKTSIYTFQNPLIIGGVLAELSDEVQEILKEYSYKAGVAFQLQDDILGMFGETEKTGKSVNSDLLQGKSTLLIAKTMELGKEKQKNDLYCAWGKHKATEEEIEQAKTAIKESGSLEYSINITKELAREAMEIAEKLSQYDLNKEAIDYLKGIAEYMVTRSY
ncbi:MAG TPA: polyprenyl synthetase family protein [Spirochaetia bacterium]|nr:polyprenyl synthetase family protein [Spirochaetia bacterium]